MRRAWIDPTSSTASPATMAAATINHLTWLKKALWSAVSIPSPDATISVPTCRSPATMGAPFSRSAADSWTPTSCPWLSATTCPPGSTSSSRSPLPAIIPIIAPRRPRPM